MTNHCSCGFTDAGDEQISDHLLEVFAPENDTGPDGLVHLEGKVSLYCLCGAGGSAEELDAHFLAMFTPADLTGRDGRQHEKVAS